MEFHVKITEIHYNYKNKKNITKINTNSKIKNLVFPKEEKPLPLLTLKDKAPKSPFIKNQRILYNVI